MSGNLSIKSDPVPICSDLFLGEPNGAGSSSKNIFIIPPYQRAYTWSRDEWSDLYDDLIDSVDEDREHFIGTFMFIRSTSEQTIHQVVDGQQRLTTLSLLFLALSRIGLEKLSAWYWTERDNIENNPNTGNEDDIADLVAYRDGLIKDLCASTLNNVFISGFIDERCKVTDRLNLKLSLSRCSKNYEEYEILAKDICKYVLSLRTAREVGEFSTKCDKRRMIWKAYYYFHTKISEEIKTKELSPKEGYEYVLGLSRKLSSWQTILITTENESQAYTLFDSLNNRGVPLSPIDIVKNTLFSKMAEYSINIDEKNKDWEDLLERINSEKLLRRFFVDYYNIYLRKDTKNPELLTENNIIDVYTTLIKKEYKTQYAISKFYDDMLKMSEIYALIIHPNEIEPNDFGGGDCGQRKAPLVHLNEMSAIPAYGFLMYLYDKFDLRSSKKMLGRDKYDTFTDVVKMLSNFFAIRHITDTPRVKHLPALFDRWLQSVKANISSATFEDFKDSFISVIKEDEKKFKIERQELVREKIEGLEYETQNTRTALIRYLFTLYEMNNPDKDSVSSLNPQIELWKHNPNSNKGEFMYSIEHIIPEGDEIKGEVSSTYWKEVLGEDYHIKKRSYFMHKLGNLGLLEPNKTAAQKPFPEKKGLYKNKSFRMFEEDVIPAEKWTRTEVEERTKKLAACMTEYLYEDFAELDTKPDSE